MKRALLAVAICAAVSGCSLIPDYKRPEAPVAAEWNVVEAAQPLQGWEEFFSDPALRQVIGLALENNRDLRVAAFNTQAYAELYRVQRSELSPSVGAGFNGSRTRMPGSMTSSGKHEINSQYTSGLGVSWEVDLFGRVRSLSEQAMQQYLATEAAQRGVQVSLVASVANAWLTWQADEALLQITRETLKNYEESLRLTQRSFDVGTASALEVRQATTAVQSAQVNLARYRRQVEQDRNALNQLVGQSLPASLHPTAMTPVQLAGIPAGLPSEVLIQRPDVQQAEFQLKAANANIGAARAAFFPSISLTGGVGSASNDLGRLFDSGSDYWTFSPSITLPIFYAGRLRANLSYSELMKDARVAEYEGTLQKAFREVADGLIAQETYTDQVKAQSDLLQTTQEYYDLANRRYRVGVDSYIVLLDAQRQLFAAQQQLIADRLAQSVNAVDLYKALGGGLSARSTEQPAAQ